jgi:hypothetical protein
MPYTRTARLAIARGIDSPILILALWTTVALVAAVQALAMARLDSHTSLTAALTARLSILPFWALATPLILRSARRFPVIDDRRRAHLANVLLHAVLGTCFVVAANVAIRVGEVMAGSLSVAHLARSTMMGLAEYFPFALIVYALLVVAGHFGRAPAIGPAAASPPTTASPPDAPSVPVPLASAVSTSDVASHAAIVPDCLTIHQWNRVHLVRTVDIDWIEAEDNYVVVHAAGKRYKGRERIGDVESRLDPRRFVRIHRSAIVHVGRIREVQPLTHGDHAVVLRDGKVLRVARSRRRALGEALAIEL